MKSHLVLFVLIFVFLSVGCNNQSIVSEKEFKEHLAVNLDSVSLWNTKYDLGIDSAMLRKFAYARKEVENLQIDERMHETLLSQFYIFNERREICYISDEKLKYLDKTRISCWNEVINELYEVCDYMLDFDMVFPDKIVVDTTVNITVDTTKIYELTATEEYNELRRAFKTAEEEETRSLGNRNPFYKILRETRDSSLEKKENQEIVNDSINF